MPTLHLICQETGYNAFTQLRGPSAVQRLPLGSNDPREIEVTLGNDTLRDVPPAPSSSSSFSPSLSSSSSSTKRRRSARVIKRKTQSREEESPLCVTVRYTQCPTPEEELEGRCKSVREHHRTSRQLREALGRATQSRKALEVCSLLLSPPLLPFFCSSAGFLFWVHLSV